MRFVKAAWFWSLVTCAFMTGGWIYAYARQTTAFEAGLAAVNERVTDMKVEKTDASKELREELKEINDRLRNIELSVARLQK